MHPYISQAIAAERVADAIRAADASRRAQLGRQLAAANGRRPHPSYRGRRAARSQSCTAAASMAVSGPARH
jgi:hypothetical protein